MIEFPDLRRGETYSSYTLTVLRFCVLHLSNSLYFIKGTNVEAGRAQLGMALRRIPEWLSG